MFLYAVTISQRDIRHALRGLKTLRWKEVTQLILHCSASQQWDLSPVGVWESCQSH